MKPLIAILFCLAAVVSTLAPVAAADAKTAAALEAEFQQEIVLADLLNYAVLANPAVEASKKSWQAFIEAYRIGKSYPDPQLTATYFPAPIETRLGPQDWNLALSQMIPFPGTLSQKGRVLASDVRASRLKVDRAVKKTITDVSSSFFELVYIQNALKVAEANRILIEKMAGISQNDYAGEKASFYDLSKARAQAAQVDYDILLLKELEQTEKAKLNTLLDRPPGAGLGRAVSVRPRVPVYSLDEIYSLAALNQEDILLADETVKKADETVKLSKFETLPTFKLGLFYAGIGDPDVPSPPRDAGDDALGIQFGLNLPLWFGKNRSRTAKALAVRDKARADKADAANRINAAVSRLWFKLQNAGRLVTLYGEELLPQAISSVHTARTWYSEGNGSFSDFLEVQATAYNFQLALERAKADYNKTLVRLEQMAGVILDRKTDSPKGGQAS